jgi:single-strand DNA-binding protein
LKQDSWEDKTTKQKQSKLKVVLESFSFIDSNRPEGGAAPEAPRPPRPAAAAPAPSVPSSPGGGDADAPNDDDVPF